MTSKPQGGGQAEKAERLAAALRENLKRRKQQARGRATAGPADEDSADKSAPTATARPPKP